MHYNTLENYGPVHKWGKWTAKQLEAVNRKATLLARSKAWKCKTMPGSGGYGRILAACPGLAKALIARGLAHVFSVKSKGNAALIKVQQKAIATCTALP